jgi:hypothetical protein
VELQAQLEALLSQGHAPHGSQSDTVGPAVQELPAFDDMDRNHDGIIDREEYIAARAQMDRAGCLLR